MAGPAATIALVLFLSCKAHVSAQDFSGLDGVVKAVMARDQIPGLSIAVVRGDEEVYLKGYGMADRERGVLADKTTLFHIGSVTKSMTAALLALVMQERGLGLDTQVRDIIPDFSMMDNAATAATVKDLLTLQMGLARADLRAILANKQNQITRADIAGLLKYLPTRAAFRYEPIYNNWMYALAGRLIEVLVGEGASWESLLRDRLLKPLGMDSSLPSGVEEALNTGKYAKSHELNVTLPELAESLFDGATAPAGSVISTAVDMAKYVRMHMNHGKVDGQQVLPPELFQVLHRGTTVMSDGDLYGPGALVHTMFEGRRIVWHNGRVLGSTSVMWMDLTDPADKIGVAVMANAAEGENILIGIAEVAIHFARTGQVAANVNSYDLPRGIFASMSKLDGPWAQSLVKVEKQIDSRRRLSEPFADWVGEYRHPFWGRLTVTPESLTYGEFVADTCHPDCSGDWPQVEGIFTRRGPILGLHTFLAHPTRNSSGSVVALALQLATDMPTFGTQMVTFASSDYEAVEQGWPRWEPVGQGRDVYASSRAPAALSPRQTSGFSTLEAILVSVSVAWAVPVASFCIWRCAQP